MLLWGCGGNGNSAPDPRDRVAIGTLQDWPADYRRFVGSGPADIWAIDVQHSVLVHHDGKRWSRPFPLQVNGFGGGTIVSAGPGQVWAVGGPPGGNESLLRVSASGVIEDLGDDLQAAGASGHPSLHGGKGALFVVHATGLARWDGERFVAVPDPPRAPDGDSLVADAPFGIAGLDQAYFASREPLGRVGDQIWHLEGETWTPIPFVGSTAGFVASSGSDVWLVDGTAGLRGDGSRFEVIELVPTGPYNWLASAVTREPGRLGVFAISAPVAGEGGAAYIAYFDDAGSEIDRVMLAPIAPCPLQPRIGLPPSCEAGSRPAAVLDDGSLILVDSLGSEDGTGKTYLATP
jgi:hypothetical protein